MISQFQNNVLFVTDFIHYAVSHFDAVRVYVIIRLSASKVRICTRR